MTAWLPIIAGVITILGFLIKNYLSDEAADKAKEEQRQKEQAEHDAAVASQLDSDHAQKPGQSQGASNAWDAADGAGKP